MKNFCDPGSAAGFSSKVTFHRRHSATLMAIVLLAGATVAWAQPDYPPALWSQAYPGHWYTTGNAHAFCVIHDMEGYYLSTISYFQQSGTQASVHYCVNSLHNGSDSQGHNENRPNDSPAGEIMQMVREQYWAWHVLCWNRYMFGTEHEGFVSSPVWYSEAMYQASAGLQRHLCDTWGIPKDRNHIIGHDEKKNASWVAWMQANWPAINATCNTHTDPGQYWDWSHFMSLINGGPTITGQPQSLAVNPGSNATFSVTAVSATTLSYQWTFSTSNILGATSSTYTRTNVQPTDAGNYAVVVSDQTGSVTSSNAVLSVNFPPSIINQPQSVMVSAGQSATFTVSAAGTDPLYYQWRSKGVAIAGATSNVFTVAFPRLADSGLYSVVVSNGVNSVISSDALLSVIQIAAWGDDAWSQVNLQPDFTNAIAVAAGAWHNLALRADGRLAAWGNNFNNQCAVPETLNDALAVAAGGYHSLAIKANGKVVAWGANEYGQTTVPDGLANVIGIAAGTWHSLALRADGTIAAWGDDTLGQIDIPTGLTNVVAIAAGGNHSLALKANGALVAWGDNTDAQGRFVGQSVVPSGLSNVVAIAAGEYHSLAVKNNATVVAWGDDSQGQCDVPSGLAGVVAVSGGGAHSLALKSDGSVAAWGANWNGQCSLAPNLTNAVGIAAGEAHTVLLLEGNLPVLRLINPGRSGGRFNAVLQTLNRKNYALEFKNSPTATGWTTLPTVTGNGALRQLSDPAATVPQRFYRVRRW